MVSMNHVKGGGGTNAAADLSSPGLPVILNGLARTRAIVWLSPGAAYTKARAYDRDRKGMEGIS